MHSRQKPVECSQEECILWVLSSEQVKLLFKCSTIKIQTSLSYYISTILLFLSLAANFVTIAFKDSSFVSYFSMKRKARSVSCCSVNLKCVLICLSAEKDLSHCAVLAQIVRAIWIAFSKPLVELAQGTHD